MKDGKDRTPPGDRQGRSWDRVWSIGLVLGLLVSACSAPAPTQEVTSTSATTGLPLTTAVSPATSVVAVEHLPTQTVIVRPDPDPPASGRAPEDGEQGIVVAALGGMPYAGVPGGEVIGIAREGLVFGVEERSGDWFGLRDQCDSRIWAASDGLAFTPRNTFGEPGRLAMEDAVVVVDPGHGGPNTGATGNSGLAEPAVNLDIARRVRDLLSVPHSIDWETGEVGAGNSVPPVKVVWVTRVEGPPGADIDSGLTYRATLATMAGAHALVSIHNNADPDGSFVGPGSEAFYQIADQQSRRLAGLIVEEFRRGFAVFDIDWVGDTDAGAKYRLRSDGIRDYYGLLRGSGVPSVIAEGAFISNPDEEDLLATPEFRQAYALAVYRALVRFLTTEDPGSGFTEPYPRTLQAGSGAPGPGCVVPQQP